MSTRFLCDRNLGKLVKWLRILGYDTLWHPGNADHFFLLEALREKRIALTRANNWGSGTDEYHIVVKADHVREQIGEILEVLDLKPDRKSRMTLCLRCNARLDMITREEAREKVPVYVHQNNRSCFKTCPICGRIYWPGTHARNIEEFLSTHIPTRLP
jgi:uncharacterized protein